MYLSDSTARLVQVWRGVGTLASHVRGLISSCLFLCNLGPKHSLTQISQSMLDLCDEKLKEVRHLN